MTDTPVRAVIYARISKAKSSREGEELSDSIENQIAAMTKIASDSHYEVVRDPYVDDGKSGFSGVDRPDFSRLLADLGKGFFDIVLVRHSDRLYRNAEDQAKFQGGCARHGIKWQTLDGTITDPKSAGGGLLATITGAIGEYESAVKRERLLMHNEGLRARGELLPSSRTFGWADDRTSEYPVEADLVRFIFGSVADGASVGAMVRYLNDNHVPQVRDGARWQHATVTAILNNARYWGAVLEPDGTVREGVLGVWAHLISRDAFETVQARMAHRRATSGRRPGSYYSTKHLLGGIIRCGVCGNVMRSSSFKPKKGGPTVPGYRCETNRGFTTTTEEHPQTRKDGLRHASLQVDEVDEAARRAVVEAVAYGPKNLFPKDNSAAEARRVVSALARLDEDIAEVFQHKDEGLLTPGQVASRLRDLRDRREPLEADLKVLRDQSAAAHMTVDLRAEVFEGSRVRFEDVSLLKVQLRERLKSLDIEKQRSLVQSLLEVTATGGRRSARTPQRFRIHHVAVTSLNGLEDEEVA